MKLNVVKADLGVPVDERNGLICERCEASVSPDQLHCPECGAKLTGRCEVLSMSTEFDSELARGNLLRMRADYRQAEELCLGVLKRFPNSIAAHTLLGDIYSDQGLLEQAVQWYELALDLDPSSTSDRQKLDDVRAQIQERDHISSIEQLGLPEHQNSARSRNLTIGIGGIVVILLLIYGVRHGKFSSTSEPAVITTPIRATADMVDSHANPPAMTSQKPVDAASSTTTSTETDSTVPSTTAPFEDRALLQLVTQKSSMGSHLISILQDPRSKNITLTYSAAAADDDERRIGAMLAKAALEQSPETTMVTMRAMKNDRLSYMADVPRSKLAETQTPEWQQKASSPDAWIAYVLTNEWPSKPTDPSSILSSSDTASQPSSSATGSTGSSSGTTDRL